MTGMRLGVDANVFRRPAAGIARYLRNMLRCLITFHPQVHLTLYSATRIDPELPVGNWSVRCDSGIRGRVASLWLQEVCPRWLAADRADAFWGQHVLPLRLSKPCRRILTVHDMTSYVLPRTMAVGSRFASRAFLCRSARVADRVIADSRATARQVSRLLGVSADRLTVVYPGIDDELLAGRDCSRTDGQADLGLPAGYLLAVGTLEPRKGYDLLLDALERLPDAPCLVVVGAPGWKSQSLGRRLRAMEHAGRVRYLGRIADSYLPGLYRSARLTVVPSLYEGFGFPVLEAMASGCPVLCSRSSSLPEVGGAAARYFRPGDVQDLAVQLRELLNDDASRITMSALGRKQASGFDFRRAAATFAGLLMPTNGRA